MDTECYIIELILFREGYCSMILLKKDVWFKGPTFLTLPESGWLHFTIGNKLNFDISKEEEKCNINSVYNKGCTPVYKGFLYTLPCHGK